MESPMEQWIDSWLHGKAVGTQAQYRRDLKQFLSFLSGEGFARKQLLEVELIDVQAFARSMAAGTGGKDLARSTQARKLAAVKSFLKFTHEQGHIPRNVAAAVKLPRTKDRLAERILSEGEVTRMIYLEPDDGCRLVLKLLYAAGLRVSELAELRRRDVADRDNAARDGRAQLQLTIFGKGQKTRFVLLGGEVAEELRQHCNSKTPDAILFEMSRHQVYRVVRAAAERAGIRKSVSPHWLRHAHASHALDRGAPAHLVRDTLGHASLATTSRYAHARPDQSSGSYLAL